MSYSDILKVKNLGKKIKYNPIYNEVVKDGLVLRLDGKDFTNGNLTLGTELVSNGDFSQGQTGWNAVGGTWTFSNNATMSPTNSTAWQKAYQRIGTLPNTKYQISVSTNTGTTFIVEYDSSGNTITPTVIGNIANTSINTIFTTKSNSSYVMICISNGTATSGTFTFDNISLKQVIANTPPTTVWRDRSRGSSYTYSNLVSNGDFSKDSNSDGLADSWANNNASTSFSISNNIQSFLPTKQYSGIIYSGLNLIQNHKYYISAKINGSHAIVLQIGDSGTYIPVSTTVFNSFQLVSVLYSKTSTNSSATLYVQDNATTGYTTVQVQQIMCIDLTALFGSGNELSQSWCDNNLVFTPTSGIVYKNNDATPSNFGYIYNTPSSTTTDFQNKISGDTTANANIFRVSGSATSFLAPSAFSGEPSTAMYNYIATQGNGVYQLSTSVVGTIAQTLFQFNVISAVEKMLGKPIPTSDGSLASKITWIKANVSNLRFEWTGYGLANSINNAYFTVWAVSISAWSTSYKQTNTTGGNATKVISSASVADMGNWIDSNGFVNLLAYTDAVSTSGNTATIYTDYVKLTITMVSSSSGSDGQFSVIFDGIDDKITIPNSNTFQSMYINGVVITPTGTITGARTVKNIVAYNRVLSDIEVAKNLKTLK